MRECNEKGYNDGITVSNERKEDQLQPSSWEISTLLASLYDLRAR